MAAMPSTPVDDRGHGAASASAAITATAAAPFTRCSVPQPWQNRRESGPARPHDAAMPVIDLNSPKLA